MDILVLGGSYFLGKAFVHMAMEKHRVTVFNRGTRPLGLPRVQEIHGDRHDLAALGRLSGKHFDVIVDFCAYQKGDITAIFEAINADFGQYIFISTCDVYERGQNMFLDETARFEHRDFGGEAGDYILQKVALEEELCQCSFTYHVPYTSIRPSFIYGPDNYAPREGMYFRWIEQTGQILHPIDATGQFQLVYVDDVARAILACVEHPISDNRAYNLAPPVMETYDSFAEALTAGVEVPFEKVPVTVATINEKNIPLPFPLTKEESNWYDGNRIIELIGQYTKLSDGLKKTIAWQQSV